MKVSVRSWPPSAYTTASMRPAPIPWAAPRALRLRDVQRSLLVRITRATTINTSRGYDPRQSPGLGHKRVVSCKDYCHGTDVLAVSEHGAPGRRPNIHAHFVAKGRTASTHRRPAPPRQTQALLIADTPSQPLKTSQPSGASEKRAF